MVAIKDSYKGKPTLSLKNGAEDKFGFTFGITKAKMILSHLKEIETFVKENEAAIVTPEVK